MHEVYQIRVVMQPFIHTPSPCPSSAQSPLGSCIVASHMAGGSFNLVYLMRVARLHCNCYEDYGDKRLAAYHE